MRRDKIIYSRHALEQIAFRHIRISDIENTLRNPDKKSLQANFRFIAVKLVSSQRVIVVAYEKKENLITVITAFITSKTKKYL